MWIYNAKAGRKFDQAKKIRFMYKHGFTSNIKCPLSNSYYHKNCSDCKYTIKYDGEYEWCTHPVNIYDKAK